MVILEKRVVGLSQLALARFVTRARRAIGLRGVVNVLVTSNREMQSLNQRFLAKDRTTDVLSFPSARNARNQFAGDIAISAEIAARNARALGHAPGVEVKILTLHGLLHLRGYDHVQDHGEMARRENRLRRQLHLPEALIERAETSSAGCGAAPRDSRRRR